MAIDKRSLRIVRQLGKGGFGIVHEVSTPRGLVDAPTCAFKEFTKVGPDDIANLEVLVDFRRRLPPADIAALDALGTWPLEAVKSRGRVVGYLMRVVPARFMEDAITQVAGTTVALRSLDWLAKPNHAKRSGAKLVIRADDLVLRLAYCAQLARGVHFLHERGVVVGDLSQINALHSGSPAEIMLIDLDTARVDGRSPAIRQAHSPGMSPPECRAGQKSQDVFTDRFKLAILFYNILGVRAQVDARLSGLAGKIDDTGMQMFAAALGKDKSVRPSARTWYRYLYDQVIALSSPPTVDTFTVAPTCAVVGQPVEVSWAVRGHRSLTIETPWGEKRHINVSTLGSVRIPLQQSGSFRLVAANPHAATEVESETVYAFEPPTVRLVEVGDPGGIGACITGIDIHALAEAAGLDEGFSWVESMLTLDRPDSAGVAPLLADPVGGTAMDTHGLVAIVEDVIGEAETIVRGTARDSSSWRPRGNRVAGRVRFALRSRRTAPQALSADLRQLDRGRFSVVDGGETLRRVAVVDSDSNRVADVASDGAGGSEVVAVSRTA